MIFGSHSRLDKERRNIFVINIDTSPSVSVVIIEFIEELPMAIINTSCLKKGMMSNTINQWQLVLLIDIGLRCHTDEEYTKYHKDQQGCCPYTPSK